MGVKLEEVEDDDCSEQGFINASQLDPVRVDKAEVAVTKFHYDWSKKTCIDLTCRRFERRGLSSLRLGSGLTSIVYSATFNTTFMTKSCDDSFTLQMTTLTRSSQLSHNLDWTHYWPLSTSITSWR